MSPTPTSRRASSRCPAGARTWTRATRALTGRPPVILAGMTPTTVDAPIVAAAANAGYMAELAGGGQPDRRTFELRVAELAGAARAGTRGRLQHAAAGPAPVGAAHRAGGAAVRSAAGGRAARRADRVGRHPGRRGGDRAARPARRATGCALNAFKPGTAEQVRQLLAIADAAPHHTIAVHLEGGRAGGHHSWEDLEELLLETYHELRRRENVLVCAGGGIGTPERAADLLHGDVVAGARRARDAARRRPDRHRRDGRGRGGGVAAGQGRAGRRVRRAGLGAAPRRDRRGDIGAQQPQRRHPPARQLRLARGAPARVGRGRPGRGGGAPRRDHRGAVADGEALLRRRRGDDLPRAAWRASSSAARPGASAATTTAPGATPRGAPAPRRWYRRFAARLDAAESGPIEVDDDLDDPAAALARSRAATRRRDLAAAPRRRPVLPRGLRPAGQAGPVRARARRRGPPLVHGRRAVAGPGRPATTPTRSSSSPAPRRSPASPAPTSRSRSCSRASRRRRSRACAPPARAAARRPGPAPAPLATTRTGGPVAALFAAQCVVAEGGETRPNPLWRLIAPGDTITEHDGTVTVRPSSATIESITLTADGDDALVTIDTASPTRSSCASVRSTAPTPRRPRVMAR